ncbi:chromosomal replication initiator DnaA [Sphingobium sp. BS19]|uniref:HdaA/DnaA family protein n=1 Tax=Sphingobium sp. BS19 TaxID=3018973 RepID=UPI0022EEB6FC|nr:chromosomal replication initiator DnaA [Sphingobium sp. BS19]GLI97559.1 regulatory inactivation of DnaA Hda protein [Sphingobium sp. BS19]|tara:strand:+ start:208 stop:840 length:633 start_codon:yes stop_codon:yes gene_type:complete
MSQISLPFDWSDQNASADDGFIVSDANARAVRHLEGWHDWPVQVSVLSGPPRSGRSTLGRQFVRLSGGNVIDDAERAGDEILFHAWNRAQLDRRPLLMIADAAPQRWTVALPDLRSRLAAVPHVRIEEPDDALVRALIERGLARGAALWSPDLPDWLHRRIERSYAAITEVIACLHAASLSHGRKISVPFAKETLQSAGFLPIVWSDPEP